MKTWFTITNIASDTAEVRIYDQIGEYGINATRFCDAFNAIKAANIDLRINSMGGSISDASAICTAIKEHPANVTAHVDGLAASSASWVAIACDSVEMAPSAFMMIHNPMNATFGTAADMRKQADTLDKMTDAIAQLYCDKTGKDKATVTKAMDDETWFGAQDAKDWGLVDRIKGDDDEDDDGEEDDDAENRAGVQFRAINSLAPLLIARFKNVPDRIKRLATKPINEANAMLSIINRGGKNFVTVDGKELEVQVPPANTALEVIQGAAAIKQGKSDEEVTAAVNAASTKAAEDAVKKEREYRATFTTIVNSAGLTPERAVEFEKNFYGRPEADLKWLASNAIDKRATAVGEGSGEPEKKIEPDKAALEVRTYCSKRFANDARIRRQYKVATNNATDAGYIAGLERYIGIETKCRADEAKKTHSQAEDPSGNDPITNILKNKSVYG